MLIASGKICRSLSLLAVLAYAPFSAAQEAAQVYLSNSSGEQYLIGSLEAEGKEQGAEFKFSLRKQSFGDYFLSMRPFECLESDGRMMCYLPYPYEKPTVFGDAEMRPLEYDLLFIQRQKKDYGIDPWNGLYYKLSWQDGVLKGEAHAVDLNVLASPPEDGIVYPLDEDDLHPLESDQLWLPDLVIEGLQKPQDG